MLAAGLVGRISGMISIGVKPSKTICFMVASGKIIKVYITISSASVILLEFTFCPADPDIGDPVPRVRQYPV